MLLTISIVSHGQFDYVKNLLDDLNIFCQGLSFEVILTLNIPEIVDVDVYKFPIQVISNEKSKGFGENHNAAFLVSSGEYFCVANPDVRLKDNVFTQLLRFHVENKPGISAPLVLNSMGGIEDSARHFPTPLAIFLRVLGLDVKAKDIDYELIRHPDWVAGMFMLFTSVEYKELNGFDERYFLYYEDVDICARLALMGRLVLVCPVAVVIHDAQRSSHKSIKYMRWHITSMLRFFFSINYLRLICR